MLVVLHLLWSQYVPLLQQTVLVEDEPLHVVRLLELCQRHR